MHYEFVALFVMIMGTAIVPWVSQFLKKANFSRKVKFLITLGLCPVTGFIGYVVSGYPLLDFVVVVTGTLTLAVSSYEIWWKGVFENSIIAKKLGLKVKRSK